MRKLNIEKARMYLNYQIMRENTIKRDPLEKGTVGKTRFAELIFSDSTPESQRVQYYDLVHREKASVKIALLDRICEVSGCDFNLILEK
jgi:hypothetical protein